MTKSPADKIKEAAAGETDPKALSEAAATTGPEEFTPRGDGKAPYKDDMAAIYARLDALDRLVESLGKEIIELKNVALSRHIQPGDAGELTARVTKLEQRLEGNIA